MYAAWQTRCSELRSQILSPHHSPRNVSWRQRGPQSCSDHAVSASPADCRHAVSGICALQLTGSASPTRTPSLVGTAQTREGCPRDRPCRMHRRQITDSKSVEHSELYLTESQRASTQSCDHTVSYAAYNDVNMDQFTQRVTHLISNSLIGIYPNFTDISTSAAVTEFRALLFVAGLLLLVIGYAHIGFFIVLLGESLQLSSIESTVATYGTVGWILLIEMTLFCGFLVTAYIVLMAVNR